jgi:hypothetical protein
LRLHPLLRAGLKLLRGVQCLIGFAPALAGGPLGNDAGIERRSVFQKRERGRPRPCSGKAPILETRFPVCCHRVNLSEFFIGTAMA